MIDILGIEPVKVSKDLSSYSTLIYGPAKIGKSSFVNDLYGDRVLHIMTEKRYKTLNGAHVQYIANWSEYLQVMAQLRKPAVKKLYDVVSIDTVDNLVDYLEKFIAGRYEENSVGERSDLWGKDYTVLKQAWKDGLLMIEKAGYTAVFVSHSVQETTKVPVTEIDKEEVKSLSDHKEVTEKGISYLEYLAYRPDLKDKFMNPINKMVDNILFISNATNGEGEEKRVIYTRGTLQWIAGSTFKNMQPVVELDADKYHDAVELAISKYGSNNLTEDRHANFDVVEEEIDFDALMKEAQELAKKFIAAEKFDGVKVITDEVFGKDNKLTDATKQQDQQLSVAVIRMRELAEKEGIA